MKRPDADALLTAYDDAQRAYRFAVRVGLPSVDEAFAKWNEARENLIGLLCGEVQADAAARAVPGQDVIATNEGANHA